MAFPEFVGEVLAPRLELSAARIEPPLRRAVLQRVGEAREIDGLHVEHPRRPYPVTRSAAAVVEVERRQRRARDLRGDVGGEVDVADPGREVVERDDAGE